MGDPKRGYVPPVIDSVQEHGGKGVEQKEKERNMTKIDIVIGLLDWTGEAQTTLLTAADMAWGLKQEDFTTSEERDRLRDKLLTKKDEKSPVQSHMIDGVVAHLNTLQF